MSVRHTSSGAYTSWLHPGVAGCSRTSLLGCRTGVHSTWSDNSGNGGCRTNKTEKLSLILCILLRLRFASQPMSNLAYVHLSPFIDAVRAEFARKNLPQAEMLYSKAVEIKPEDATLHRCVCFGRSTCDYGEKEPSPNRPPGDNPFVFTPHTELLSRHHVQRSYVVFWGE